MVYMDAYELVLVVHGRPGGAKFVFATGSHAVVVWFGGLGLIFCVRVNFVAMVRVSKLSESNFNPNCPDPNL